MGRKLQRTVATAALVSFVSAAQADGITLTEMRALANGMEAAYIDVNSYVTLENLNDLPQASTYPPYDSIQHNGGIFPLDPFTGVFRQRRDFSVGGQIWESEKVIYQQGKTQTNPGPYDLGSPLDRWDTPYLLFNPHGLLRGDVGKITQEHYGDQFAGWTIVSFGPDGIKSSDDIIYPFGTAIEGAFLTSLSGTSVTLVSAPLDDQDYEIAAGTTVTLHGINLNPSNQEKAVLFGATVVTDIISWSNREVKIIAPAQQTGNAEEFIIQLGTGRTGGISARITGSTTGVNNWADY